MQHKIDHTVDIDALARQLAHGMSLETMREKQGGALSKGSIPPLSPAVPITDGGRKHLESLRATSTAKVVNEPRRFNQAMPYDDADFEQWVKQGWITTADNGGEITTARRKVWGLFQMRAAHISMIENRDFDWELSEKDAWIIRNLTKYFINDQSCEFKGGLGKGLFLYGLPGTGKTEIMQIFEAFCEKNQLKKKFQFTSMSETYVKAKSEKGFDPITKNVQLDRCFDEFGLHVGAVMTFGESMDINEAIIEARYKRFRQGGQITHFISNATPNQLEDKFSPMIFDRLRSMCTGIHFEGQSKRTIEK